MPKLLAKFALMAIGLLFGLFCLFLANIGAVRLYGWSQTGRLAPPTYPALDRYDVISFAAEPFRAALEIGGNAFLVAINLCGLAALILTIRRGLDWIQRWPALLPLSLVMVFWTTASTALVGRADWILPASALFGVLAAGIDWIFLWRKRLPITARVADFSSQQGGSTPGDMSVGTHIAVAALLALLAILKAMTAVGR